VDTPRFGLKMYGTNQNLRPSRNLR
jgi:hypothetical protein